MNKTFISTGIFVALLIVIAFLLKSSKTEPPQFSEPVAAIDTEVDPNTMNFPEPPEGAIVFNMAYCGLDGGEDELRYNSYWGFGGQEKDTPFIKALKKNVKNIKLVYNPNYENAQWSAIEMKKDKPVAFYFDLNADGEVSSNEKFLPIHEEDSAGRIIAEFVTPDFIMNSKEGDKIPFRTLLQVSIYNQSSSPNFMWSPSCVLEGTSTINGEQTKLILFSNGFNGSFSNFGSCAYYLKNDEEKVGRNISRQTLSSIINYNGQFYTMKLEGTHAQDKMVRVLLEKYTGSSGELAVKLVGNEELTSEFTNASIKGTKKQNINFSLSGKQDKLPVSEYKLNNGYINYGTQDNKWRLNFTEGPEFTIKTDETTTIELGKPVLTVSAIDEGKRYENNVKEQTVYAKGKTILLSRKVIGTAGENYGYFWDNKSKSIKPEIKIVDSDGKEVASREMEYG
jgi:hypothetical protein